MAEIAAGLGVAGNVANFIQLANPVMELVSEFWKAPARIRDLEEQLDSFGLVLQEASTQNQGDGLNASLTRARTIHEELKSLSRLKLRSQSNKSNETLGKARRVAWVRHRGKVAKLCERLSSARQALPEVLGFEAQSALVTITQQSAQTNKGIREVGVTLENIKNALSIRRDGKNSEAQVTSRPESRMAFVDSERKMSSDGESDTEPDYMISTKMRPGHSVASSNHALLQRAGSITLNDQSISLCGEAYSVDERGSGFFCYHTRAVRVSDYFREYQSALFFRKTYRQWVRLTLTMTVSVDSDYWGFIENVDSANPSCKTKHNLPVSIDRALESFLRSGNTLEKIKQDSHLSVLLDRGVKASKEKEQIHNLTIKLGRSASFDVLEFLLKISRVVEHWIVRRFFEGRFIHKAMPQKQPWNYFVAYIDSRWVYECRLSSERTQIDWQWYTLKTLHRLGGPQSPPGISPLLGVVLDKDTKIISSFLWEFPRKGDMLAILRKARTEGKPVDWNRRVKWCRQTVAAIAEMHSRGSVIGTLCLAPGFPVGINEYDDAVLFSRFSRTFPSDCTPEALPPECHATTRLGNPIRASFQTDIYHAGYLIWCLTANKDFMFVDACCAGANCTRTVKSRCPEKHLEEACLPISHIDLTRDVLNIIAACRAREPNARPPAVELVKDIIRLENKAMSLIESPTPDNTKSCGLNRSITNTVDSMSCISREEELLEKFGKIAICDVCAAYCNGFRYHCGICQSSDFDLCLSCFAKGLHCDDSEHCLREYCASTNNWDVIPDECATGYYYSAPDQSGRRNVKWL